jgi:ankyrin repeat protein
VSVQDNEGATALHVVAELNHLAVANLLLAEGADLNMLTRDGFSPLHCAATNGHRAMTELLVDSGASILAAEPSMVTPLHLAAAGHPHCLEVLLGKACQQKLQLLQQRSLSSSPDRQESTALVVDSLNAEDSSGDRAVHKAAASGDAASLELLAVSGADVQPCTRALLENLVHLAASSGEVDCVRVTLRLLGGGGQVANSGGGKVANSRDRALRTPLHRALGADVCLLLLEAGAQPESVDHDRRTVLHCAAALSSGEHVRLLLARLGSAAPLLAQSARGRVPLHCAAAYGNCDALLALLHAHQAETGLTDVLPRQLSAQDAKKRTALHIAAAAGHTDAVLLLLEAGSDPAMVDCEGSTALHLVVANQEEGVAAAMLGHGRVAARINDKDRYGQTCLHLAAGTGSAVAVTLLAAAGANLQSCTLLGNTPLHLAASLGRLATAHALLRLGVPADLGTYTNLASTATPLLLAAGNGHRSLVRLLLKVGGRHTTEK